MAKASFPAAALIGELIIILLSSQVGAQSTADDSRRGPSSRESCALDETLNVIRDEFRDVKVRLTSLDDATSACAASNQQQQQQQSTTESSAVDKPPTCASSAICEYAVY